ncbi:hypothetical protein DEIGR_101213 [Deinococcus grandis]|uniref:Uncharacterized protein n=1 Tax=Deinococcus grandis TaxID=57498 RepID=A0A100HI50_9DEIO|nr:hypothetical protein [Deinococcus grandis]BBN95323.1 hypothetical protein DEGR_20560 [Deinococcus grandis]GAQ21186.1 hypothetical protein DEIGR_101213 [Deinococcus grandis]
MSAISRSTSRTSDALSPRDEPARESARPAQQAHPSWQFHDQFDLWIEWMERDSSGVWHAAQPVTHRTFRTREDTLKHAERVIQRGEFPMERAMPVTLVRNRREALLAAFREAEGDGVTLIRDLTFPVGEYGLSVRVTRERQAQPVRAAFASAANPLRSLIGQPVKLTVLIEHPYDVLSRAQGTLDLSDRAARIGEDTQLFSASAQVSGLPYQSATVTVPRGLLKKPLLYRFERVTEGDES